MVKFSNMLLNKLGGGLKVIKILKNWPTYFNEFFGNREVGDNITFRLRKGIKCNIKAGTFDRNIFNEVFVYEVYNPEGFRIKPTDIVVDIGANSGIFSIYSGHKARKGKVYAFEPVEEDFKKLKENILLNKLSNIIPINKAVSNKNGLEKIFVSRENNGGHSFFKELMGEEKNADSIMVDTISFKDFFIKENIKNIDLLKIDCEGAEYQILYSLKDILKNISKISMEVHRVDGVRNVFQLKKFLEEVGFFVRIKPNYDDGLNLLYAINKGIVKNL